MDGRRFKRQSYKILCVSCRAHLFNYFGDFKGKFDPENFKPSNPSVRSPQPKTKMVCSNCGHAWYMTVYRNGKLIVMTDRGWRPRDPEGPPKILLPEDVRLTVDYKKEGLDYAEPVGR